MGPSSLTLLLDCTLRSLGTQIIGDDATGMLHVQKVGGQGTLRGIGVVRALLALLLLRLHGRRNVGEGHHELARSILKVGEELPVTIVGSRLSKQKIGLADVVSGEGA